MPAAVIIGAGPGIGASVARRFAAGGMDIGLIARTRKSLEATPATAAETADVADERQLIRALDALVERLGVPEALVYNVGLIRADRPGELTYAEHQAAYAINVLGALAAASHLAPAMPRGTILITGGMQEPDPAHTSLSLGKAGVRAATAMLAQEYPHLHVATVLVAGTVARGTAFDPDDIAEEYWRLHAQPREAWERDVLYAGALTSGPLA